MAMQQQSGLRYKGTLQEYEALLAAGRVDANSLYFCTTTGGFCIFLGSLPLVLAPQPQ